MGEDARLLVHMTDTHLVCDDRSEVAGVRTNTSFASVMGMAVDKYPDAQAYVLTGDLSHDGSAGSYQTLRSALEATGKAAYVVPGNHDDLGAMRSHLASSLVAIPDHVDLAGWRLIFLNSQVPGEEHGRLDRGELDKLRAALTGGPRHCLVCVHHPLVSMQSSWIDRSRLVDPDELLGILEHASGRAVVLCGHAHQEYLSTRGKVVIMGTPSTCAQFTPGTPKLELDVAGPGFRTLELHPSGDIDTRVIRLVGRAGADSSGSGAC